MSATAPRLVRIAVLECLQFPENIGRERGTFTTVFGNWLERSVTEYNTKRRVSEQVVIRATGFNVVDGEYPEHVGHDFDAIIVTGSMQSAYDKTPWIQLLAKFLQVVYMSHQHVRIYGGCFGHQLVAQTLLSSHGVHAEKSPMGWEIGVQRVTLSPQFKEKFSLLKNTESMSCQFLHSDHVAGITGSAKLPPDWMTVGKSELCEIQGLFQPGRVLTFQGHPEFDKFIIKTTISNLEENGQFDHKEASDYLNSANQEEDVILFGHILISFMVLP